MRTAGARARRGAGPERGGRGRDSGRGPGAHGLSDPQPPPARTHPHRGPGAGPSSTPRGDHYITPRPAAPSPAAEGGPEPGAPGGGRSRHQAAAGGGRSGGRIYLFSAGEEGEGERGARGGRLRRPPERGLLGGLGVGAGGRRYSARPPRSSGPASSAPGVLAAPPPPSARCEAAALAWLSARASSLRPLAAGAAAARSATAGGGLGGWGRRSGRGHREEVSVFRRLLLSPLFAPASLWR